MNIDTDTRKVLAIIAIVAILIYLFGRSNTEGYERDVIGGSYGKVQDEIFWYPYPDMPHPGTRHVKYDPTGKVHSSSYIYPDHNVTVNEPHNCEETKCGPAFAGEDVKCYNCPQYKRYDSGL